MHKRSWFVEDEDGTVDIQVPEDRWATGIWAQIAEDADTGEATVFLEVYGEDGPLAVLPPLAPQGAILALLDLARAILVPGSSNEKETSGLSDA